MVIVAVRLWSQKTRNLPELVGFVSDGTRAKTHAQKFWRLALLGFGTGVLSGLLGVGGGFILVPGLAIISRIEIHRAIATAMFSVALVSAARRRVHIFSRASGFHWKTTELFPIGGLLGLWPGT